MYTPETIKIMQYIHSPQMWVIACIGLVAWAIVLAGLTVQLFMRERTTNERIHSINRKTNERI